eukprot:gene14165-580_t
MNRLTMLAGHGTLDLITSSLTRLHTIADVHQIQNNSTLAAVKNATLAGRDDQCAGAWALHRFGPPPPPGVIWEIDGRNESTHEKLRRWEL